MSKELHLATTAEFDGVRFDCYQDKGKEFWGTREQIGQMLGYSEPRDAIAKIHQRNRERLDRFSGVVNLSTPGGEQKVTVYNFKGLLEICRYSSQPKADAVMDFLWEMADQVRKFGEYSVKPVGMTRGLLSWAKEIYSMAGLKGNQLTLAMDKAHKFYTGVSLLSIAGVQLEAPSQRQLLTPTDIGRELGTTGRKVNNILAGAGYQHKIGDKWEPIGPGESYAVMLDTGKQHSNGTPVRQLKWDSSIVEIVRGLKQEEEQV